jgi:hypothetical protein
MKIKNFKFKIISALLFVTFVPNPVFAHILKSNHAIGAVLHVNPEDDPIAGQESSFFFEFKDKENKFTAGECFCTFSVLRAGKVIGTQSLFQNISDLQSNNAGTVFTFPDKDVYIVRVTGKPKTDGAFQAFQLDYTIRVDRGLDTGTPQSSIWNNWWVQHTPHILIIIIIIAYIIKAGLKERATKKIREDETY